MPTPNLDRAELEKKLEEIFNLLVKKGLVPALSPTEKKDLIKTVSETIINDPKISLTKDDLEKENVQKSLGMACMAQLLNKNDPNYRFDYTILFKKQVDIEPEDLQHQLKLLFTNVLKLNPSYKKATKNEQAEMEAGINELTLKMTALLEDNKELLLNNPKIMNIAIAGLDMLSEQRRNLYGVDTHQPGSVVKTVTEVPFGEQMGLQDLATTGESFMAKRDEAAPVPDPLGIHMAVVINFLADGNTTAYEQYLKENDVIPGEKRESPTPFHTKPSPFDEN